MQKKTSRVYQALTFKSRAPKSLDQLICWEVESPCWKNIHRSKVVLQQLVGCGRGDTRPHWTISCLSKWPGQRLVLCHFLGMRYSTGGGCLGYPFSVDAEGYREVIKGHSLKGSRNPGKQIFCETLGFSNSKGHKLSRACELTAQEVERIKLEDGSEAARDQLVGGLLSGLIIPSASKC